MKWQLLIIFFLCTYTSLIAQQENIQYDSLLAKKLGADDYGMKTYVLAVLVTGEADSHITDKAERQQLFKGHFANIKKMAEAGIAIVAGPFDKNDSQFRGMFIMNVASFEEAKKWLEADPTIAQKIFDVQLYKWYGSAALPTYLENHKKIER